MGDLWATVQAALGLVALAIVSVGVLIVGIALVYGHLQIAVRAIRKL